MGTKSLQIAVILLLFLPASIAAQQAKKLHRVCILGITPVSIKSGLEAFRSRVSELGYVGGQTIAIEQRYAKGQIDELPKIATELVWVDCEVIVTAGTEAAQAASTIIKTTPIVMAFGADAASVRASRR